MIHRDKPLRMLVLFQVSMFSELSMSQLLLLLLMVLIDKLNKKEIFSSLILVVVLLMFHFLLLKRVFSKSKLPMDIHI